MDARSSKVVAVVVSYNRSALLQETLEGLLAQTRPVDQLIVVDNASTDNAVEVVRECAPDAELVRLSTNTGGAGGFTVGLAAALRADADWIWLMDDDTVPSPSALEALLLPVELHANDDLVLLGSRVIWTDGTNHPMNTPKQKLFVSRREKAEAQSLGGMAVRTVSFVSAFVRASRVREVGLPIADYFLWNDDFEFTARVVRGHRAFFAAGSVVEHRTVRRGSSDDDPGERFFFEVRNKLWLFRWSRGFNRVEKLLYLGATIRRWFRTFRNSASRDVLLSAFRKGVSASKKHPRANGVVLEPALSDPELLLLIRSLQ